MSKILLPFLLVCISCSLSFGKTVDENTAKTIGYNFLQNQGSAVKLSDMSLVYQATSVINGATVTDFYVFNSAGGGFVMVSADDKVIPVLAYDNTSSFVANDLFVNVNDWMNTYKKEINYVIKNNTAPTAVATAQWNMLQSTRGSSAARTTGTTVRPLVPVQWNQTNYVNALCPYDSTAGSLTLTGCVATAMAQVMRYWRWPVTGTGSNAYSSSYGWLSEDFATDTFQWSLMPEFIGDSNYYVAKIMYDAGVSVNMDYGVSESGSFVTVASSPITNCAQFALPAYFGYKISTIQGVSRYAYDDSDWLYLLQSEITAKRPVLYTGSGSAGGHCFIADGYSPGDFIHFNWGWGGASNGNFIIENLDPGGTDFNDDQTLIIGIMPDTVTLAPAAPPVSGVSQVIANTAVNVYPNPAASVVNIDIQGTEAIRVILTDMLGRVVTTITPASAGSVVTIPVNTYSNGMYLVEVQTAEGTFTKQLIIAR